VGFLEIAGDLWDAGEGATALALESGVGDLGADVGGLPDDALDGDEVAVVFVPDSADVLRLGRLCTRTWACPSLTSTGRSYSRSASSA